MACKESGKCIEILFPLFSRKPISPIKNCGNYADIAEIYTILKIAAFVKIARNFLGKNIIFTILSDGKKYSRACKTPDHIIDEYQKSIKFWINYFKLDDCIYLNDYEARVLGSIGEESYLLREEKFYDKYNEISLLLDKFFKPEKIFNSMSLINNSPIRQQIYYTFYSIITSINYDEKLDYFSYIHYIESIHDNKYKSNKKELFINMRKEAWEAAKKYVAISLIDRQINIIDKINKLGLKFTIHPKTNEFRFLDSPLNSFNLTAQHCVGGISMKNNELSVNFDYRICRESREEQKVCIFGIQNNRANIQIYGYLTKMVQQNQAIFFTQGANIDNF
nr:L-tyrosine/L-tryptophan isonitrile synthase family protein [uncultured Campylobacter sp.]